MDAKQIINESLVYIENNLTRKITIEEIANYVGYSKFYFSRIFKAEMSISVMEYVKERKIICASQAILRGKKILDVAIKYGWESHGGFIKAFKSYYGFSPSLLYVMNLELNHLGGSNMGSYNFYEKTDEHMSKEQLYELLVEEMKRNQYEFDLDELEEIYNLAKRLYANQTRYSGDEYITHLINVSLLLVQMGAEKKIVCAGMFCDVFRKTDVVVDELKENLPEEVFSIVIRLKDYRMEDILSDEECAIIKMAERLHNMRTIEYMKDSERKRRARETISLYMPVARQLKNEKLIKELKDLSIRYVM